MPVVLSHKLESDVEIKASAEKFHDMFWNRPHHLSKASGDKIKASELHEGAFAVVGFILNCTYVHDGKTKKAKYRVEAVESDKNLITFRVLEGDLIEEYKSFTFTMQVTNKSNGTGAIVHWSLEYQKLHEGVDHPESRVDLLVEISKDIDAYLIKGY